MHCARPPKALFGAPGDLLKGLGWIARLRRQVPCIRHVAEIEGIGELGLERIRHVTADGRAAAARASVLLVHEGLAPTIHPTLLLGCRLAWNNDQDSFAPELDNWGETSERKIFVAGDAAGIGGARAACLRGELAALRIAVRIGRPPEEEAATLAQPLSPRAFLDRYYRPRPAVFIPPDQTIACRCEEVRVAAIREQANAGRPGPNQVKAFTRAGMGPCQGRLCRYTVAHVLAAAEGRNTPDVGLYRVRPPLKPVKLSELATLDTMDALS